MKFCAKCGNSNVDEAVFCSGCGSPLEQAPAAPQPAPAPAPEQPAYSAPAQPAYSAPAQPAYTAPAYSGPDIQTKNSATLWLILNIVSTVICCSGLFGILGIIFAGIGMSSFKKGNFEDMKKKSKVSMILFIVSVIWGIFFEIVAAVVIANWGNIFP